MAQSQEIPTTSSPSSKTSFRVRIPPSYSGVKLLHLETTVCYSYMCPYAYRCSQKNARPSRVLIRRCMRYLPDSLRGKPAMSEFALDLLARRQQKGQPLTYETKVVLERVRPNGPTRKVV